LAANQISGQGGQPIKLIVCATIFDRNISAFSVASLAQTLPERSQAENIIVIPRCTAKKPDHRHRRLLRLRRKRPRGYAAA